MPFFWRIYVSIINISKKYKMNKPSLRVHSPENLAQKNMNHSCKSLKKRVSSFISNSNLRASITLEASLVLPFFLFASISLISMINVMKIKSCVDMAVAKAGNEIAVESYGGYIADIIKPFYIKQKIETILEENLTKADIEKLSKNIYVTELSFLEEENIVFFRVDYSVSLAFGISEFTSMKLHTTYYGHNWLGYARQEEKETMVFISKNASVYHPDKNCTYLYVTIQKVPYKNVESYRNDSGKKYGSCSFCNGVSKEGMVYITSEGESYHTVETCIGLTRSIYTVPLSTVSYKSICTRCGE